MNAHPQIISNVRMRLAAAGLSATEAAKRAGISATTLTRPLNDPDHRFALSTTTLAALCGPLGCDLSDLVGSAADDARAAKALRLRTAREKAKYPSATAAAKAMGISAPTYIHHENGTRDFDNDRAYLYAATFLVSPTSLIFGGAADREPAHPDNGALPHGAAGAVPTHPDKITELREQLEEITDLLHALDRLGDGIGAKDGYAVSAVALTAKPIAENALDRVRSMEAR